MAKFINASKKREKVAPKDPIEVFRTTKIAKEALAVAKPFKGNVQVINQVCPTGWSFRNRDATSDGWYISHATVVDLSPIDARDLFVNHNYSNNRSFSQHHAENLSAAIECITDVCIAVVPKQKPVIVNSQHRLWAIWMRGKRARCCFIIYHCKNISALGNLFSIFDAQKRRSFKDGISAYCNANNLSFSVSVLSMAKWASATESAEEGFCSSKGVMTTVKVNRVKRPDIQEFAEWAENLMSCVKDQQIAKLLTPKGVSAAIYAMYLADKAKAEEFIVAYLTGLNLDIGPIYKLRNDMLKRKTGRHVGNMVTHHAGLFYSAWLAHCTNKKACRAVKPKDIPKYDKWDK